MLSNLSSRVTRSAFALMLSTGATAILGLVFWAVAVRGYSAASVGRASAELSAMALLAQLGQLNLANAFIRLLPRAGGWTRSAVLAGYGASTLLAAIAVVVFLLTPLSDGVIPAGMEFRLLFAGAVLLWTIFVIQDGVLTGLRKAAWVPVENIGFSVLKLLLLPVLAAALPGQGVFWAWTLPVVLAVGAVNAYLFLIVLPARAAATEATPGESLPDKRSLLSFVAAGYLTSLMSAMAMYLLPIIVIKRLGATANAHFYLPWLVGIVLANLMANVMSSFIVEVSHADSPFRQLFWRSTGLLIAITIGSMVVILAFGTPALRLLSPSYASAGESLLRWIGLSIPFSMTVFLLQAAFWIERRVWLVFALDAAQTALLIGLSLALIGTLGINAIGVAVLVTQGTLGLASAPPLIKWYRSRVNGEHDLGSASFFGGRPVPA